MDMFGGSDMGLPQLPAEPDRPPMLGQIQRQKPGRKSTTPSFLGSSMTPSASQTGGKTLLGQ